MHKYCFFIFFIMPTLACADTDLSAAVDNVRTACGGIADELGRIKTLAGVNTAISSVGTVAAGTALGTGIAKAQVDKKADAIEAELAQEIELLNQMAQSQDANELVKIEISGNNSNQDTTSNNSSITNDTIAKKQAELEQLTNKSKKLGDWRTGTMATSTATNIASTVIAGTNRIKGDIKAQITECISAVQTLSNVRMQARISQSASETELGHAAKIISACQAWETVDIESINNKSVGAAASSGIGAGLGLAGTVTSAVANSKDVRAGDNEKEKKLNTASNILAGGTTVASGVAVVLNATQIKAINHATDIADECQEALK